MKEDKDIYVAVVECVRLMALIHLLAGHMLNCTMWVCCLIGIYSGCMCYLLNNDSPYICA